MRAKVFVTLKPSVFDPQGQTIADALQRGDDGIERNDIKRIVLLRVVESPAAGYLIDGQGEGGHS